MFGLFALGMAGVRSGAVANGQTVERDTTITGPRGRTIKRQVEVQRGPGSIERQVQIQRPGGTFDGRCRFSARRPGVPGDRRSAVHGRGRPGYRGRW